MEKDLITKLIETLVEKYSPQKVILFGSHAWGKPTKDSDIDLFIVKSTRKKPKDRFSEVQEILYGLHQKTPV